MCESHAKIVLGLFFICKKKLVLNNKIAINFHNCREIQKLHWKNQKTQTPTKDERAVHQTSYLVCLWAKNNFLYNSNLNYLLGINFKIHMFVTYVFFFFYFYTVTIFLWVIVLYLLVYKIQLIIFFIIIIINWFYMIFV